MGQFINQNSYVLLVITLWVIAAIVVLRNRTPRSLAIFAGLTVVLLGGFFLFRLEPGTSAPSADIKAQIGAGKPVLLEFRSQN